LILFHLPDAIDVLAHHMAALRPGGVVLAIDFDGGSIRAEPPVDLSPGSAIGLRKHSGLPGQIP
jgi:hypothetical protein